MKRFKKVTFLILIGIILTNFTQCKSTNNAMNTEEKAQEKKTVEVEETPTMQGRGKESPFFIKDTYFQRNKTGSVTRIYFPTLINKSNYKLDKVYFRGMIGDIQSGKAMYFSNLKSNTQDLVMSNNPNAEFGNTTPTKPEPFPFELKNNECMLSYIDNGKTKYFQVYNIVEKQ